MPLKPGSGDSSDFLRSGGALNGELGKALAGEGRSSPDTASDATGVLSFDRIGPYEIRRLLGSGGMGDVFLAYDARLQRHVAIKRIGADRRMNEQARERLRREAAAAAALTQAAIVGRSGIL